MKSPKIKAIHHIAIKCRGIEEFKKTVEFYEKLLGLKVIRTWGNGENQAVMLDTGAGIMEIFANGKEPVSFSPIRHLAIEVEDTDACVTAVRSAGYQITTEPKDICIPSNPPCPARIAFCIGAAGEEIEFFQPK